MAGSSRPLLPLTYHHSSFLQRQPSFNVVYNMPTINYVQPQHHLVTPNFPHPIVSFIMPVILNLIELNCQCKSNSPFETNPITMWFGLSCLLAYCLAYGIEMRFSSRLRSPNRFIDLQLIRCCSMLLGSLCLASLLSILLPSMKLLFYGFYGLLSIGDIVQSYKMVWKWIHEKIVTNSGLYEGQQAERNILPV